jgi:hypothetical protein
MQTIHGVEASTISMPIYCTKVGTYHFYILQLTVGIIAPINYTDMKNTFINHKKYIYIYYQVILFTSCNIYFFLIRNVN